jgi:hypothetical protein
MFTSEKPRNFRKIYRSYFFSTDDIDGHRRYWEVFVAYNCEEQLADVELENKGLEQAPRLSHGTSDPAELFLSMTSSATLNQTDILTLAMDRKSKPRSRNTCSMLT